jgi:hypothetical protein
MTKTRTVLLCGNSLVLTSIGATLQGRPGLRLHQMPAAYPDAESLQTLRPDVIIFDLVATPPGMLLPLLRQSAGLRLIGLDLANDQMLLWSGEQARALETQELMQALGALPEAGVPSPGRERRSERTTKKLTDATTGHRSELA